MAILDSPATIPGVTVPNSNATQGLTASGQRLAVMFPAPKAGTIRYVSWRTSNLTSTANITATMQGVDAANGFPNGTVGQTTTIPSGWAQDTWVTADFGSGSGRTVTEGELVAAVIESTGGSYNMTRNSTSSYTDAITPSFPGGAYYNGTSWSNLFGIPVVIGYADGSSAWIPGLPPALPSNRNVNTGTNPNELAQRVVLAIKRRVTAFNVSAFNGDFELRLRDLSDNAVIGPIAVDKDIRRSTNASDTLVVRFPAVWVDPGTYRVCLRPTTGTSVTVSYGDFPTAASMDQVMHGQACYGENRQGAGAWNAETTRRYLLGVLSDQIDTGSGGASFPLIGPGGLIF